MNMTLWQELDDKQAEKLRGGAGSNIPSGFYEVQPLDGQQILMFKNGRIKASENAGMMEGIAWIYDNNGNPVPIGYDRTLPNGKYLEWGSYFG